MGVLARCFILTGALLPISASPADPVDYRIEVAPKLRVGPVNAQTTRAELDRLFGKDFVKDGDVGVGEGETEPGTIVNGDDPSRALAILWRKPLSRVPSTVRICYELRQGPCRWQATSGITYGTTLKELERLNGRPFRLMGFAWDYEGTVMSWQGGLLEAKLKGCGRLMLRLRPDSQSIERPEWRQVLGAREYSSGHPAMQKMNLLVYDMLLDFSYPNAAGCVP